MNRKFQSVCEGHIKPVMLVLNWISVTLFKRSALSRTNKVTDTYILILVLWNVCAITLLFFPRLTARVLIGTPSRFCLNVLDPLSSPSPRVRQRCVGKGLSDVKKILGIEFFRVQFPSCHLKKKCTAMNGTNEKRPESLVSNN